VRACDGRLLQSTDCRVNATACASLQRQRRRDGHNLSTRSEDVQGIRSASNATRRRAPHFILAVKCYTAGTPSGRDSARARSARPRSQDVPESRTEQGLPPVQAGAPPAEHSQRENGGDDDVEEPAQEALAMLAADARRREASGDEALASTAGRPRGASCFSTPGAVY
jgi:hypothetical protein